VASDPAGLARALGHQCGQQFGKIPGQPVADRRPAPRGLPRQRRQHRSEQRADRSVGLDRGCCDLAQLGVAHGQCPAREPEEPHRAALGLVQQIRPGADEHRQLPGADPG
jgi:hypothetical protein